MFGTDVDNRDNIEGGYNKEEDSYNKDQDVKDSSTEDVSIEEHSIEDAYFVRRKKGEYNNDKGKLGNEEEGQLINKDKVSSLEEIVKSIEEVKGIKIQHVYETIEVIAVQVTGVEALNFLERQYDIEPQHRISYDKE